VLKILGSPDPIQRREAITSLRSEPSAGAVLILQRAVYDSDDYVRTSAQSQLARWSEASEVEIKHLEKRNAGGKRDLPRIFWTLLPIMKRR
jgi:HEAT repeat protein